MTVLTFPTLTRAPGGMSWRLRALTQTHTSPLDGTTQTLALPGARWAVTADWPSLMEADRRALEAFLARLGGRAGRFTFGPLHAPRRASGTGSPVINGAGQSGAALSIRGWASGAQAFRAGDFLSYTDTSGRLRLHMATADVTASGGGVASVPIAPPIRRAGLDGAAVEVAAPVGVFMLSEDEVGLSTRPPLLGSVTLDMVEALA